MNPESGMANFSDLYGEDVAHMSVEKLLQLPPREGPEIEQSYPQGIAEIICDICDSVHSDHPFLMEGGPPKGPPLALPAATCAPVSTAVPGNQEF